MPLHHIYSYTLAHIDQRRVYVLTKVVYVSIMCRYYRFGSLDTL